MDFIQGYQFLPGDPRLVEHIVHELKSQGIFDQFRKECLADVDTKPAYQNLRQRVEGCVSGFLDSQKWKPEMNKNQLREKLRKTIQESGFLESGVERIVEQVVNPKISTVFLAKVEEVVYKYHGLEKPTRGSDTKTNGLNQLEICTSLLPNDLEAISPDSVNSIKLGENNEGEINSKNTIDDSKDSKIDEDDESPPFEPLNESNENSNDSHLSGISGLTSQDSLGSPKNIETRDQSSDSKDNIELVTNGDDTNLMIENNLVPNENVSVDINEDNKTEDLKMDVDSLSCDSDAKAMVIVTESSNDAEINDEKPLGNLMNGLSIKTELDNSTSDKEKSNSVQAEVKSEKNTKSSHDSRKKSSSHRNDKHYHHSSSSKSSSRHRSDSSRRSRTDEKDKHRDSSRKRSRDRRSHHHKDHHKKETSSDKHKNDSRSKSHSSHSKSHSKPLKIYSDDSGSDQNNKDVQSSSNDNSSRDSKKDSKYRKKSKTQTDDHGSAKNPKTNYRRSTDRDSNDGNGLGSKKHCSSIQNEQNTTKHKESTNETMERCGDQNTQLSECVKSYKNDIGDKSHKLKDNFSDCSKSPSSPLLIRKPKIASNIFEARRLIKVRRKIEKQVQRERRRQQIAEQENADLIKKSNEKMIIEDNSIDTKPNAWKCIDSEDSDKSENSAFFGFASDRKVFHDSDDDMKSTMISLDEKSPVIDKQNSTKSQAEIMEIIFGCGVAMNTKECSPDNEINRTSNGFQVSYCSDYDDVHDDEIVDEGNVKDQSKIKTSVKSEDVCTNNNVLKKKTMSAESKLNNDYEYTPNGLSENKNRSPTTKSNNSTKTVNDTGNVKTKSRSSAYSTQCYSNEDLYKPRPSFGSTRRRKVSASYN